MTTRQDRARKLPPITIVVTTWVPEGVTGDSRLSSLQAAVDSWRENLVYSGDVWLHFADDGSRESIKGLLTVKWHPRKITYSMQGRLGVGASLNTGFEVSFGRSPLVAYFVDDWELRSQFDLTPWAELLVHEPSFGMVRFGPPSDHLTGQIDNFYGSWAIRLDKKGYVFSHRPALYHQRFYEAYGPFLEKVNAVECEEDYHKKVLSIDGPGVAFALPCPWVHVGDATVSGIVP